MFCYYCGKEIGNDVEFCPFCGKKVKKPIAKVESEQVVPEKKRNKAVIVIVIIVAVAIIAAIAFFLLGKSDANEPSETEKKQAVEPENSAIAGATEFNGNYYEVVNNGSTWSDAKSECEAKDGHLVIITSQEEENFIEELIEGNRSENIYHYWLGATDEDNEGTWTWLDGQTFWQGGPIDKGGYSVNGMYQNWLPSQPNNSVKEDQAGQDYLEIQVTKGNEGPNEYMTWTDITNNGVAYGYEGADDYNDTQYYGYICEWEGK